MAGSETVIEGVVTLDGAVIPRAWIEALAELLCEHGKLIRQDPADDRLVEPDA